jgi:hypothetical protein
MMACVVAGGIASFAEALGKSGRGKIIAAVVLIALQGEGQGRGMCAGQCGKEASLLT